MSDLGLEIEERDGGIFVKEVQEHGCVAVHGMSWQYLHSHCVFKCAVARNLSFVIRDQA